MKKMQETPSIPFELLDESITSIYVADAITDELLFLNNTAKKVLQIKMEIKTGQKCYEYLMHRDTPCPFCHKSLFKEDEFCENNLKFPFNGRKYRIYSKLMMWGNRRVHVHYITDITTLLDKEKELRTLTDFIPTGIGIYYVYPNGQLESDYLNDGYYKMMETTREKRLEYSGFSAYKAIFDEDLDKVKLEIQNAITNNRQIYSEFRMKKDDGTYKWVSIRADIYEKTKEKVTLYCAYSDIDQLKQAQQEQIEREKHYEEEIRLKTSVSANVKVLMIADLTNNIVLQTDIIHSKFGKYLQLNSLDHAIEIICKECIHPLEQESYLKYFNRNHMLRAYARGNLHGSFRHQLKNLVGWYESCYDLVLNPYNRDIEVIASIRDVTEIVRSEQVINTLMSIDYESIITIDADTGEPHVMEASDAIHEVIKEQKEIKNNEIGVEVYLKKHCIDKDIDRVIKETSLPYVKERLAQMPAYMTMYSLNIEGKIMRKRAVYAYLDYSRRVILCARQDVTQSYNQEQKRNEELAKALQETKEANYSKAKFFANMSHDMRTPLNGILGSVSLAIDEEEHSTKMSEYLHDIQFSGEFLLNLINDILDWSKIENEALVLHPEVYTYFEFIDNMTKMINPLCKKKNITLNMNPLSEDVAIKVDILRFQQIFFNIFSNAVKFTPKGGIINHYTIVEPIDENHIDCKCHIIDNGIGMSKEFQEHLFDPYSQENNKISVQGTGLGLSIANQLAHLMGGELLVKSKMGEGTEVVIHTILETLPIAEKKAESINLDGIDKMIKNLHLLLCEDHPLNAKIAIRLLEKYGAFVELAEDGKQGIKLFSDSKEGYYDLILMDIRMPVMTGLEAAKIIRKLNRKDAATIPILAMTANAYEEDIKKSIEAGMNGHLAKPICPMDMYREIVKLVKANKSKIR